MFDFVKSAEPHQVQQALRSSDSSRLIDVRSRTEFHRGHARGAISVPLERLDRRRLAALGLDNARLFVICESGVRAEQAVHRLNRHGMADATMVIGGTQAWRVQGLPMTSGITGMPLHRQIQVAVGVVLLLVLAKSMLLHPAFYALAAMLGVAMILAGDRTHRTLQRLLAAMPWNRHAGLPVTAESPGR